MLGFSAGREERSDRTLPRETGSGGADRSFPEPPLTTSGPGFSFTGQRNELPAC